MHQGFGGHQGAETFEHADARETDAQIEEQAAFLGVVADQRHGTGDGRHSRRREGEDRIEIGAAGDLRGKAGHRKTGGNGCRCP